MNLSGQPADDWAEPGASAADPLWAIYARLSIAGDEDQDGVDRQIADCSVEAKRRGARRIRIYSDDGFSASKRKVVRPAFERLLVDIKAGELAAVIAWRAERFARQPLDVERLVEALGSETSTPQAVAYTLKDGSDTRTESGMFMLRVLVMFGRWEVRAIGQRLISAHTARLEQGRFSGSPPAFGHRDGTGWREVEPAEAEAIREAATRLVAGEGVRSIIRTWNERGLTTREGNSWQHRAWSKMVTAPRMAGLRRLRGIEVAGNDADGRPWIAPIMDVDLWREVRRVLEDPARRPHNPGGKPSHLLTGLMRCGALCHLPLRAKGQAGKNNGPHYWTYGCVKDVYHPNACGKVWIKGGPTDAYIEQVVLAYLRMPNIVAALSAGLAAEPGNDRDDVAIQQEFVALQERITQLEAAWLRGPDFLEAEFDVSPAGYRRWRIGALERLAALEKQIAHHARAKVVIRAIVDPPTFWAQAALAERREIVRAVLPVIWVDPAVSVPNFPQRWDQRRIRIEAAG